MNIRFRLNILSFITVFLWSTAFPLTKLIGTQFSASSLGFIRCACAAVFLIAAGLLITHIRKPSNKLDMFMLFIAGALGFALYIIFFSTGISTLTSATSSIIVASTPIMTAAGASFLYKEHISRTGWLCIISAFIGVAVLMLWNGVLSINTGIIWTLGAAVFFCCYNLLNRKLSSEGYSAAEIVTYGMISGAIVLSWFAPQAVHEIMTADPISVMTAIYLGLMPSAAAYLLWAKSMEYAEKTSEVTNYMFITPLLSAILGFIILGETPDAGTLIGGTVIIASVVVFSFRGK